MQDHNFNVYKFSLVAFYDANRHIINLDYILPFNRELKQVAIN